MTRDAALMLRRVRQTLTAFDNGPQVLAGMARRSLSGRPDELLFKVDGLRIVTPNRPGARVPLFEVFAEDEYRIEWLTRGLGPSPVAIDIGAHVGSFTLALAVAQPDAQVEAFEASPSTGPFLVRNIDANHLGDRVRGHQVAVSAHAGTLEFGDSGAGSGHNGVLHLGSANTRTIQVSCITMRDAFETARGSVDLVKLDAEGAEYSILDGSDPADWASVRRVVMEYHDLPGHSFAEIEAFLTRAGLRLAHRDQFTAGLGMAWFSRDGMGPKP